MGWCIWLLGWTLTVPKACRSKQISHKHVNYKNFQILYHNAAFSLRNPNKPAVVSVTWLHVNRLQGRWILLRGTACMRMMKAYVSVTVIVFAVCLPVYLQFVACGHYVFSLLWGYLLTTVQCADDTHLALDVIDLLNINSSLLSSE